MWQKATIHKVEATRMQMMVVVTLSLPKQHWLLVGAAKLP
jgi:hypothetical protein